VFGDQASKALGIEHAVSFADPRLPELGVRVLTKAGEAAALLGSHGFVPAASADYDALRLSLGVPDGSRDLPVEKALLLESGFDELNGVDWKKGCYMGQELTARTKYRGLVKKRLFPVRLDGPLPAPGTLVERDGQEVGEIRSGLGDRALAMLRLDSVGGGMKGDGLTAGGTRILPEVPDWMRLPATTD
jgi:folate-binding protein YgfZ